VRIRELDAHINDPEFAAALATEMMRLYTGRETGDGRREQLRDIY
jgi:hypothetical protein